MGGPLLVEMGHGEPPLGLLHHVGPAPQVDVDHRRRQLAGLAIHLHGDGLVGCKGHFLTLMEPLAVPTDLQRGLDAHNHRYDCCNYGNVAYIVFHVFA